MSAMPLMTKMPPMPVIETQLPNYYQNFKENSTNKNNYQLPYTNHMLINSNDYASPSDYYSNTNYIQNNNNNKSRDSNNNLKNYSSDTGNMGINKPMNTSPNMNANAISAYTKDSQTPQTRDRLRIAGNNIFN